MIDRLLDMSIEDIKNGYSYDNRKDSYVCSTCGAAFENGEVFESGGRYFDARRMAAAHVRAAHGDMLAGLSALDKKDTGLTENQRNMLAMIAAGMSDADIARANGVAASTVRHQKFVLRERAKQSKLYLAIYELAAQGAELKKARPADKDQYIPVHSGAKMVDDRYRITVAEEEKMLSKVFYTLSPLKLKNFPAKEKGKLVVLRQIAALFDQGRKYTEKQVNEILLGVYADFATIRRYLIEYGFMDRTTDCREYWLK